MRGSLDRMIRETISEKVSFEFRSQRREGANWGNMWKKRVQRP